MRDWGQGSVPTWWRVIARNKQSIALDLGAALAEGLLGEVGHGASGVVHASVATNSATSAGWDSAPLTFVQCWTTFPVASMTTVERTMPS